MCQPLKWLMTLGGGNVSAAWASALWERGPLCVGLLSPLLCMPSITSISLCVCVSAMHVATRWLHWWQLTFTNKNLTTWWLAWLWNCFEFAACAYCHLRTVAIITIIILVVDVHGITIHWQSHAMWTILFSTKGSSYNPSTSLSPLPHTYPCLEYVWYILPCPDVHL